MEFRVSIYDGANGVILSEIDGKRNSEKQGNIKVDDELLDKALDKVKEAVSE